jgi:lipoyl(octanoyl) transferase
MRVSTWGLVPYLEAQAQQLEMVELVAGGYDDTIIFCSHPAVVTVGRGTKPEDIFGWSGELVETSRGGRATYHGPNQIIAYPILNLTKEGRGSIGARDIHSYLRALEVALVKTLKEFDIDAEARTVKINDGPSLTGVWVGSRKIASLGIAVKKWITYHGLALNVFADEKAFTGINPCGFSASVMTSMEQILGRAISGEEVRAVLEKNLLSGLSLTTELSALWPESTRTV